MAIRFLERRDKTTLDEILCDPDKAQEFDRIAAQIAPGFTSLQYRWAALSLCKASRLAPEIIGQAIPAERVLRSPVVELNRAAVPRDQGLYLFYYPPQVLYVGEAANLRIRIDKHLDHSDNKGLARWMWEYGTERIFLELHVLNAKTSTRIRRALETELIRSRKPIFNVQRTQAADTAR